MQIEELIKNDCIESKILFNRYNEKENTLLLNWIAENRHRYRVIYLDYSYSNSNYHTKDRTSGAEEVLIVND